MPLPPSPSSGPAVSGETLDQSKGNPGPEATATLVPGGNTLSLPGYQIEGVLGRGGMGVVFKARHLALKRVVAIKAMLAGEQAGPRERARFRAEAEAVARLQHPNIVQIHEIGEASGHLYFVLELVEGGSLERRLRDKSLLAREAARLVEQLARAMQLAHSRNVVHRDLKPANILLTADGTPKVTDFGIARHLDSEGCDTLAGAVMGTPSYMAPEQAAGHAHEAGPAADVWALGAIFYACLTGWPPFKGQSMAETLALVQHQEPLPLRGGCPDVPPDLETICLKCLRKQPETRYASAAELADDLGRWMRGEPVQARPVGLIERGWLWCRRNPGLALLWLGLMAALLGGVVASTYFAFVAQGKATEALNAQGLADRRAEAATAAQHRADQAAALARANERLAYDRAYGSDLRLFPQAWDKSQFDFAYELLDRQRPEKTDGEERRGFEWNYWDGQRRCRLLSLKAKAGVVGCLTFSPDGKFLAAGGDGDFSSRTSNLTVWDAATGREIRSWTGGGRRFTSAAFSPDGKRLVTSSYEQVARIWDVEKGKPLFSLEGHPRSIQGVAWSRDGNHLATAGQDGTVRLWDAATGRLRRVLTDPGSGDFLCVAFSPDSNRVAAGGSGDQFLRVWEVASGKKVLALGGHSGPIRAVAFSADGKRLASGCQDGHLRTWDARGGDPRSISMKPGTILGFAFSPDGKRLASANAEAGAMVWDIESGQHLFSFRGQPGGALAVAFSVDGKRLASCGRNGSVAVWDATAAERAAFGSTAGRVVSLAISPDGKTLLGGNLEGQIRAWDPATGRELRTFGTPPANVQALAIHPGGQQVATQGNGSILELWNPQDGTRLRKIRPEGVVIRAAAYSPDGATLATVGLEGKIWLRSAATLRPGRVLQGGVNGFALAYSRRGDHLALRDNEGVKVWEVATGRLVARLAAPTMLGGSLAFSPDGQSIAAGDSMGMILVWSWKRKRSPVRLTGHSEWVTGLAYSPDGKRLASCSWDRSVKLWNQDSGEQLLSLPGDAGAFYSIAFDPSGHRLFAGAEKGIRAWGTIQQSSGKP